MARRHTQVDAMMTMLKAGLTPLEPYSTRSSPWKCRHSCGRTVFPRLADISTGKSLGCAYCAGLRLEATEVVAHMRNKGFTPVDAYPGSHKPWRSIHNKCGNETAPSYHNVMAGSGGCAHCARNLPDMDRIMNAMRSAGLEPLEPYKGDGEPWKSRHTCGRIVSPRPTHILRGSGGCKHCAGLAIEPKDAIKLFRSKGLEPLEPYPGTSRGWHAQHSCGQVVTPRYRDVASGKSSGCSHCTGRCAKDCGCSVRMGRAA